MTNYVIQLRHYFRPAHIHQLLLLSLVGFSNEMEGSEAKEDKAVPAADIDKLFHISRYSDLSVPRFGGLYLEFPPQVPQSSMVVVATALPTVWPRSHSPESVYQSPGHAVTGSLPSRSCQEVYIAMQSHML